MSKKVYRLIVDENSAGVRLDQFVALLCDGLSRSLARKIIDIGGVHLDGRRTRRSSRVVTEGQRVEVYVDGLPLEPFRLSEQRILYRDTYLIGLDKPAGIATQPTPARYKGTLYDALCVYLGKAATGRSKPGVGMVQRLDRETSGVMIFSVHQRAHKPLTEAFRSKRVGKTYLALAAGVVPETQGVITSQLARRRSTNLMVSVPKGGKFAETRFRRLENLGVASLLQVEIPTGRSHQIRAHFAERGHPLLGDQAYGGPPEIEGIVVPRQMLHAQELKLDHPVSGKQLALTAAVPEDFTRVLDRLRQNAP